MLTHKELKLLKTEILLNYKRDNKTEKEIRRPDVRVQRSQSVVYTCKKKRNRPEEVLIIGTITPNSDTLT